MFNGLKLIRVLKVYIRERYHWMLKRSEIQICIRDALNLQSSWRQFKGPEHWVFKAEGIISKLKVYYTLKIPLSVQAAHQIYHWMFKAKGIFQSWRCIIHYRYHWMFKAESVYNTPDIPLNVQKLNTKIECSRYIHQSWRYITEVTIRDLVGQWPW